MDNNKILYIAQEITPYLPENPHSLIGRDVPQSVLERGYEVRTFMPKYGNINERRNQLHEVIRLSGVNIVIDDSDHQLIIKVATLQPSRMQVYFIDNEDYFQHHAVSDIELRQTPEENDERAMFFARGVIETVKKLRWEPAVIHHIGWISALAPVYLKKIYADDPSFRNSKLVISLVDDKFDGNFDDRFIEKLRMDDFPEDIIAELAADSDEGKVDYLSLMKMAIRNSDGVVVTSPDADNILVEYAKSIGKPILEAADDTSYGEAYIEFYKSL